MSSKITLSGKLESLLESIFNFMASKDPRTPIYDFVQNGVDAVAKSINVDIVREKGDKGGKISYIVISDDGMGFSESFERYSQNISNSIKKRYDEYAKRRPEVRGEFALGIQGFRSMAKEVFIMNLTEDKIRLQEHATKKDDPDAVKMASLRMMHLLATDTRGDIDRTCEIFEVDEIDSVLKSRGVVVQARTGHGVTVILKDLSESASKSLDLRRVKAHLSEVERNYLVNKTVRIWVSENGIKEEVTAVKYEGEEKKYDIEFPGADKDVGKRGAGKIQADLYFHAEKPGSKVALTVKRGPVYTDITKMDEFDKDPWNSRMIEGMIEYDRLNLEPGRSQIRRDGNWENFIKMMQDLEAKVSQEIKERIKKVKKMKDDELLNKLKETFRGVRRETNLLLPGMSENVFKGPLDHLILLPENLTVPVMKRRQIRVFAYDDENKRLTEKDNLEFKWGVSGALGEKVEEYGQSATFVAGSIRGETAVEVRVKDTKTGVEKKGTVNVMITFPSNPGSLYRVGIRPLVTTLPTSGEKQFSVVAEDVNGEQITSDLKTTWDIENNGTEAKIIGENSGVVILETGPRIGSLKLKVKVKQVRIIKEDYIIISVVEAQKRERHPKGLNIPTLDHESDSFNKERHCRLTLDGSVLMINDLNEDYRRVEVENKKKWHYILLLYSKELAAYEFKRRYGQSPELDKLADELMERNLSVLCSAERNF